MRCCMLHNMQRSLDKLEQCILALEQEPHDPEEPSISDSKVVSGGDEEAYENAGPCLAERHTYSRK